MNNKNKESDTTGAVSDFCMLKYYLTQLLNLNLEFLYESSILI